jgi:hypothetical protein
MKNPEFWQAVARGDNDAVQALIDYLLLCDDPRCDLLAGFLREGDINSALSMLGLPRNMATPTAA